MMMAAQCALIRCGPRMEVHPQLGLGLIAITSSTLAALQASFVRGHSAGVQSADTLGTLMLNLFFSARVSVLASTFVRQRLQSQLAYNQWLQLVRGTYQCAPASVCAPRLSSRV